MNRKDFIKSIAGLIGIAAVAPVVLLNEPVNINDVRDCRIIHANKIYQIRMSEGDIKTVFEIWKETGTITWSENVIDTWKKIRTLPELRFTHNPL